jgi:hypothetical protein
MGVKVTGGGAVVAGVDDAASGATAVVARVGLTGAIMGAQPSRMEAAMNKRKKSLVIAIETKRET